MTVFTEYGAAQNDDSTFDLSALGASISANDLQSLKSDVGKCLTVSLFKKLLDVEQVTYTHTTV